MSNDEARVPHYAEHGFSKELKTTRYSKRIRLESILICLPGITGRFSGNARYVSAPMAILSIFPCRSFDVSHAWPHATLVTHINGGKPSIRVTARS